jgi:ketosteroid isomerase-like protein
MSQENVEVARQWLDAFNRRDKAAWLALCDPEFEWVPPSNWPENAPIRGQEAIWEFIVELDEAWEEGSYDIVEVIDCGDDKVAGRVARHVRGKASGVDADFEYWNVVTLRRRKWLRSEWFTDRAEALEAAGLRE